MHLLLLRHAPADSGFPDASRALTASGCALAKRVATGLRTALPGGVQIASSPLRRARQTAAVLAQAIGVDAPAVALWPALAPGGADTLWPAVRGACAPDTDGFTLALVGHSPDLEIFAGSALGRLSRAELWLDKAGACLIHFPAAPAPATGTLVWLQNPA